MRLRKDVLYFLCDPNRKVDPFIKDQLKRSAISVGLNIAEGAGRFTVADKRRFYVMARSSLFECLATLQILLDLGILPFSQYEAFYQQAESISKMLLSLIRK